MRSFMFLIIVFSISDVVLSQCTPIIADGVADNLVPAYQWKAELYQGFFGVQNAPPPENQNHAANLGNLGNPTLVEEAYTTYSGGIFSYNDTQIPATDNPFDSGVFDSRADVVPGGFNPVSVNGGWQMIFRRQAVFTGQVTIGFAGAYFDDNAELFVNGVLVDDIIGFTPFLPAASVINYTVAPGDEIEIRLTNREGFGGFNLSLDLPSINVQADITNSSICAGGATTIYASAINNNVTYTWSLPNGTQFNGTSIPINNAGTNQSGVYSLTTTDQIGCNLTSQVNLTVNANPTIVAADIQICQGESATISANGGNVYTWDNGLGSGQTHNVSPNVNTVYTVTGVDVNGCIGSDNLTVTVNPVPIITTSNVVICAGENVNITANGAIAYTWDNGLGAGQTQNVSPNTTTTYTVTGTNASGCLDTNSLTVTVNPGAPVLTSVDVTICDGDTTTISAAGGVNYNWDNGLGMGQSHTVSPNTSTTYTVTGTDANGCDGTGQVSITVNPLDDPSFTIADYCEATAASIPLVTGSQGGSFSLASAVSNGETINPTTGVIAGGVGGVTYDIEYTTSGVCPQSSIQSVTVNPLPIITAADVTICPGVSATISANGAQTYVWDNGLGAGQTQTVTPQVITTYTVTGTDVNGCENSTSMDVIIQPSAAIVASNDVTICDGDVTTISATGGVNYTWDNGLGAGQTQTVSPQGITTYTVTGTDANGCSGTDQVTVTVNPLDDPSFTIADYCEATAASVPLVTGTQGGSFSFATAVSNGETINPTTGVIVGGVGGVTYDIEYTTSGVCPQSSVQSVTVNALPTITAADVTICPGGSATIIANGAQTYIWDNGLGVGSTQTVTPQVTTTYTVTGTDANGCENSTSMDVIIEPSAAIVASNDTSICAGELVSISATGGVNYTWNNGLGAGQSHTVSPLGTTTFTVTGTDANGCTGTDDVTITVNPLPVIDAGADQIVCENDLVTVSASGAQSYVWDNGIQDGVGFVQSPSVVTYTVIGTDGNGCQSTDQLTVTVNALPVIDAGPDQALCDGSTVILTANGAQNYVWDNGVQNGVAFQQGVSTVVYTVTGTDINGCSNDDQVAVTIYPLPVVDGNDETACFGTDVTLMGSGAVTYQWDNNVVDGVPFTVNTTTTYTVTGTDANGCVSTGDATVTVLPLDDPSFTVSNFCEGTAGVVPVVTGLTGGAFTLVNPTNGASVDALTGELQNGQGATDYFIEYTTNGSCPQNSIEVVTVYALPVLSVQDTSICLNDWGTISASGAQSYVWDNGLGSGATQSVSPPTTMTYTVIGTDANGCENTASLDVTVFPLPAVFAGNDTLICENASISLSGQGAVSYTWNQGITDGVSFTPTQTQSYVVIGTDANGCQNTDDVVVEVELNPEVIFFGDDLEGCVPLTTNFTNQTQTLGALDNCVWEFSNGVTLTGCNNVQTTFDQSGLYDVTLTTTTLNGCTATTTYTDYIYVEADPIASFEPSQTELTTVFTEVDFENTSTGAIDYNWDFGDGSPNTSTVSPMHEFPIDQGGSYTTELIAYSYLGCTDTAYATIKIRDEVIYYVPNTFTPDDDEHNQTFQPVFTAGVDPYDFTMYIFNRWGEVIFESRNYDVGWDGTYNGSLCQDGTYTWKMEFKTLENDERRIAIGHVNLMR